MNIIIKNILLVSCFTSCIKTHKQKENAVIVGHQKTTVLRQMGINDVYDTTRVYKAAFLKDSVCFMYYTNGKFNVGDIISNER